MAELRNSARERMNKGEPALGCGIRQARTVDIAPAMKTAEMCVCRTSTRPTKYG